jgi:hypothetical protein
MPGVMFPISTTTLSTSASTVTFSSIPNTYKDLVVRASVRTTYVGTFQDMQMTWNGFSANNYYSYTRLSNTSNSLDSSSFNRTSSTNWQYANIPGTSVLNNTFSTQEIYIPNYAGSELKCGIVYTVTENNSSDAQVRAAALLDNLTAAVSSISFSLPSADYAAGSTFTLYGIS